MIHSSVKKIVVILSLTVGAGIGYYVTHKPTTEPSQGAQSEQKVTIDEYDHERDEKNIKDIFYEDYYWLYPDTSYDVETHMGFTLKYRAPNENPLYVGTLQVKVLHVDGKFAGFTAYHIETLTRYRLLFLAIKKEFRKRGFGEMLARYAVEQMKKMGAKTIILCTRVNNPAQNIYRRVGFEETSHDNEFLYMALQVKD